MSMDLEVLFSSAARVEVLRLFFLHPERQFYQREIERETGQPITAVQRETKRLQETGLLVRSTEGNRVFYQLNPEFPLLAQLTGLFQAAAGVEPPSSSLGSPPGPPPEPSTIEQPFPWMETSEIPPLPSSLRRMQMEGEWDQAY